MKKLKSSVAILALILGGENADARAATHTGFYAGAHLGSAVATQTKATSPSYPKTAHIAGSGMLGGLHMGYGHQFGENAFFGAEAWGNKIANSGVGETKHDNDSVKYKVDRQGSFGVAMRPGVVFGQTLLYGKFGVDFGSFKHTVRISNPHSRNAWSSGRKKNITNCLGIVSGIGFEIMLNDHIKLGLEGMRIDYNTGEARDIYDHKHTFKTATTDLIMHLSHKW
jgi:outer membrane immunogenic protein